jgi:hypothetical protein
MPPYGKIVFENLKGPLQCYSIAEVNEIIIKPINANPKFILHKVSQRRHKGPQRKGTWLLRPALEVRIMEEDECEIVIAQKDTKRYARHGCLRKRLHWFRITRDWNST